MALPQVGLEAIIAGLPGFEAGAKAITRAYDDIEKKGANVAKASNVLSSSVSSLASPFTSIGQSVLNFGAIAGGTALVGVGALTAGIGALGIAALGEIAKFERMSLSIQNLVAREISQGKLVEQQAQARIQLTQKEVQELEKLKSGLDNEANDRDILTARIQEQKERIRQLTEQYGENGLVVIKERAELQGMELNLADLNSEIDTHNKRISELTSKNGQLTTVLQKVRVGQMSMTEAMELASPRAQELIKWIQMLAIQSPFNSEDIQMAFQTALAYGFTSEQAQRLTEAEVDFIAATGKSAQAADLIALALGQIQARGKLSAQELRQLSEQGVGVNKILEDMGFTLDDVTNGLVPVDKFIEAVITDMEVFKGAAKEQATTFAGLITSLGEIKSVALREFFTGTFKSIQPYLAQFVDFLTKAAFETGSIKEMGNAIGEVVGGGLAKVAEWITLISELGTGGGLSVLNEIFGPAVFPLWRELSDLVGKISLSFSGMGESLTGLIPSFSELSAVVLPAITTSLAFINEHFEEFKGALVGIGAVLGVGVFTAIAAGLLSLLTPVNLIIAGAALLGAAWVGNWGDIQGITFQALGALTEFSNFWQANWPVIQAVLLTAWTVIQAVFNGIVQGITAVLEPAIAQIGTAFSNLGITWSDVGQALWQSVQIVFGAIGVVILGAVSVITGLVGATISGIGTMVQYWQYLMQSFSVIAGSIMALFTSLSVFWTAIFAGDFPTALSAAGVGLQSFLGIVGGIVASIVTVITGMGATIYSFFRGFVNTVVGFWQGLFDTLVGHSIIPDMMDKIVEVLTGVNWIEIGASMIQGILKGIEENQAKVWEILKDMAKKAIEEAGRAIGFGSPAKKLIPLGASMIQGLMVGVDTQSSGFKDKLNKVLQDAINLSGALATGGLSSPIRQMVRNVFKTVMTNTEQLGNLTGESLANMVRNQLKSFGYDAVYVEQLMKDLGYNYEQMAKQLNNAHSDLMRELRLEAAGQSITKASQFLTLGQTAADRLQSQVDTLTSLVAANGGEYLGNIYSAVEAQALLNAALEDQASVQKEINALAQQQADLQFLQQQVDILKLVQENGLDASQIFKGITFGLDASLPDLIAATSNVVQAMIDQINADLQIASPSKVMAKIGEQVNAGLAGGLIDSISAPILAAKRMVEGVVSVTAGQISGQNVSNIVNNNFSMDVSTLASSQAVTQQFQVMRAMV